MTPRNHSPLLAPWTGPYGGVPPLDRLDAELFPEALQAAIDEARAEVEAIAAGAEPPTFENTLAALERTGTARDRVERLFAVARENVSTPALQAVEHDWLPRLAAASDEVFLNPALFARIDAVAASADTAALEPDQQRLTRRVHDLFVRRGARLDAAGKARLSRVNQEMAGLFAEFRRKVLAEEDAWTVLQSDPDLAGLPAAVAAAAAAAAAERHIRAAGIVVNTRSSVDPFLAFSSRRDLRERVWRAFKMRGDNGNVHDTNGVIVRIVGLRSERATLLGYPSHAHWQMADSMAREPAAAHALMAQVWPAALARVREDVRDLRAMAAAEGEPTDVQPWDYLYLAEKVRKARYDLDQTAIKPYLALDNMVAAAIWSAERRFDLAFREITGRVPVFHPDVRVWEVTDGPSGAHRGLFYLDNFARAGKRSGAWAVSYRDQHRLDGPVPPAVSNNNNFMRGAPGEPVLISLDDLRTLFHEFGHGLHALLQEIRYPSLASTPADFAELPSQVNENWMLTREVLDRFARHCETGAPMPDDMVERIQRSRQFNQGYATVEYLAAAILDLDLHATPRATFDPAAFERETLGRLGMPREIALRHRLTHFDHLFGSDEYAGGYYSYLWADVMAADAWQAFREAADGPWDRAVAERFRRHVLAEGNATDRAEAYRRFRGRDPDPRALFEARGLPPA